MAIVTNITLFMGNTIIKMITCGHVCEEFEA